MPSFGCCKVTGAGIGANLSEERFPLIGSVPSVCFADISPPRGESPRTPFQRLLFRFFRNGIRFRIEKQISALILLQ